MSLGVIGPPRRALSAVAALGLLVGGLWALGAELPELLERPRAGAPQPAQWKLGWPSTRSFREAMAEVDRRLPEGAVVAVDAPDLDPSQLFFLTMWCAYELPRQHVLRLGFAEPRHLGDSSYVLHWPPAAAGRAEIWRGKELSISRLGREDLP